MPSTFGNFRHLLRLLVASFGEVGSVDWIYTKAFVSLREASCFEAWLTTPESLCPGSPLLASKRTPKWGKKALRNELTTCRIITPPYSARFPYYGFAHLISSFARTIGAPYH